MHMLLQVNIHLQNHNLSLSKNKINNLAIGLDLLISILSNTMLGMKLFSTSGVL